MDRSEDKVYLHRRAVVFASLSKAQIKASLDTGKRKGQHGRIAFETLPRRLVPSSGGSLLATRAVPGLWRERQSQSSAGLSATFVNPPLIPRQFSIDRRSSASISWEDLRDLVVDEFPRGWHLIANPMLLRPVPAASDMVLLGCSNDCCAARCATVMSNSEWNDPEANVLPDKVEKLVEMDEIPKNTKRKRVVVVGLGMVGVAFIEKLMKLDVKRREYDVIVIGEEAHLAYNRVGLTSFFQHREVENLYLNPASWYASMPEGSLNYHLNSLVTSIDTEKKSVETAQGQTVPYDILVLATGSDALLPRHTPGYDANGVFVYRTIDDLQKLISFATTKTGTTGAVVGGGLLGLEAAKAMMDLEEFSKVKLIERNRWVLSRQLDGDAGLMVVEQVRALGLDVLLSKRVGKINTDAENNVTGVTFEDGESMDCTCICFAIGIKARDELARKSGISCADRGGGIIINPDMSTSVPDVYAIGECASWESQTFGLIAPGIEMADILAFNLTQVGSHTPRKFSSPDLSTKLKLLGVEVASFGDFFADRDGPKSASVSRRGAKKEGNAEGQDRVKSLTDGPPPPAVKALTYKDPFQQIYKKYLFTVDGKYLLGGMMIGDTKDYVKLVPMVKKKQALQVPPSEFIVGAKGDDNGDDLDDDVQVCSCHNVTKGDVAKSVKDGTCKSIGDVKSCTKAGTGCGGCMPLVQTIFNKTMESMGQEVKNHLCPHFDYSRADLFNIIYVKHLETFPEIMKECGKDANSTGCEVCKPAIGSITASLFNKHVLDKDRRGLQDTNDRFLANIQRNGTYSVVPRVAGGEITAERLIILGTVAKKFGLYCKITAGQRVDLFGARKNDLPLIWKELIEGGMERYKSIRSPHKMKGGVSGCVRECAEAQNKDFGLVATDKGWNIYVGGNGGATPRHCELLAKDVVTDDVVPILDRYLAFYIRTADRLQRTARWIENLPGGIAYLREVILEDRLGLCADLEKQMQDLIGSFFCEWTEALKRPDIMQNFAQFANTDETLEAIEKVEDRTQQRPAYWPKESATENFRGTEWSELSWQPLAKCEQFVDTPTGSSVAVKRGDTQLAIFKVKGKYYATQQMCPHKRAFVLSDGLIGEDVENNKLWVSCPLHKRNYTLGGENAGGCSTDETVNIATFPVEAREDGLVYVKLPPIEELDSVLGTEKWKVRKEETEVKGPFEEMDKKFDAMKMKGRKSINASHLQNGLGSEGKARSILAGVLCCESIHRVTRNGLSTKSRMSTAQLYAGNLVHSNHARARRLSGALFEKKSVVVAPGGHLRFHGCLWFLPDSVADHPRRVGKLHPPTFTCGSRYQKIAGRICMMFCLMFTVFTMSRFDSLCWAWAHVRPPGVGVLTTSRIDELNAHLSSGRHATTVIMIEKRDMVAPHVVPTVSMRLQFHAVHAELHSYYRHWRLFSTVHARQSKGWGPAWAPTRSRPEEPSTMPRLIEKCTMTWSAQTVDVCKIWEQWPSLSRLQRSAMAILQVESGRGRGPDDRNPRCRSSSACRSCLALCEPNAGTGNGAQKQRAGTRRRHGRTLHSDGRRRCSITYITKSK
nr:nitrite reductase [nad(p)h] [Quercus suber]